MKLHKRSSKKLEEEMDIMRMIRSRMFCEASIYGQLTDQQFSFSKILGQPVISEYSSTDD
jgi:hypothetical protein